MMQVVNHLFGGHKAAARGTRRTIVRLEVEGLEERTLMAAGLGAIPGSALGTALQPHLAHAATPMASSIPANPVNYTPDNVFKLNDYWIDVPSSYDQSNQTPTELFVWSHGCGGYSSGDIYNVLPTPGGPQYIAIALDGAEGACWDMNTDPARVIAAIGDVETHFNIDPQRVVLGGYSSGGDLSYRVAFSYSNQIAGVLVENTSPFRDTGLTQDQALAAPFHFHIVHLAHTEDETYPLTGVLAETSAVQAAGAPGDGWASLQLIQRPGTHWDADNGDTGTVHDMQAYLLPHLGDGWTSAPPQDPTPPTPAPQDPAPQTPGTPTTGTPTTGTPTTGTPTTGTPTTGTPTPGTQTPAPQAPQGAPYDELAAYRPTDGTWSLASDGKPGFNADDRVITGFSPAGPNVIPVAADWAGIGTDEIGDFQNGTWHLDLNNNGVLDSGETFQFGGAGDVPVPGHYLAGGGIELAVFHSLPSGAGEFIIADANWLQEAQAGQAIGTAKSFIFGAAGDRVVVGDWNGDGLTKVGVFRSAAAFGAPNAAVFSLDVDNHETFDGSTKVFIFGAITDGVVIGDWNGSGTDKVGVYRPATAFGAPNAAVFSEDTTGQFTFDSASQVFIYGTPTDKFVTGRWAYKTSPAAAAAPATATADSGMLAALMSAPARSNPTALDTAFASS